MNENMSENGVYGDLVKTYSKLNKKDPLNDPVVIKGAKIVKDFLLNKLKPKRIKNEEIKIIFSTNKRVKNIIWRAYFIFKEEKSQNE